MKRGILPPTYFMIFLILSIIFHFILPIKKIIPTPVKYFGILPIVFGIIINIWADQLFKKKKTTVNPHEKPSYFETKGPFSFSRHPMYMGMAAILFGVSILLGSIIAFIFPIIFIIITETRFISLEEKNCEKTFGERYKQYRKKVRRWI